MWLCSVALTAVMEAVSAPMKRENGKRIEHVNTLWQRGGGGVLLLFGDRCKLGIRNADMI